MRPLLSASLLVALMLHGALSSAPAAGATTLAFGPSSFGFALTAPGGVADTQAGGHPYELTTRIALNSDFRVDPEGEYAETSVQDVKDVVIDLPLGFLASALATPRCTFAELSARSEGGCPPETIVGHILTEPKGGNSLNTPLYNLVPEHGIPAEFGYVDPLAGTHVLYASIVPTPAGYLLRTTGPDLPQVALTKLVVTFFGYPAERDGSGAETARALLTNPSACAGQPLFASVHMDSWLDPGAENADGSPNLADPNWVSSQTATFPEGVTGCGDLRFEPSLTLAPEAEHSRADEPAGYEADLRVPQNEDPAGLATPPLKDAVLTLPAGVAISPAAAEGLSGCQAEGPEGIELDSPAQGHCPGASSWGEAEALSPLLGEPLPGRIYLAEPTCGGHNQPACTEAAAETGGLFSLYLEVGSEASGVHLKLKGEIEVGGSGAHSRAVGLQPGQLRVSFAENPQLPLSELKLKFEGGPRAPLANPQSCGSFSTTSTLEPWSHQPAPGEAQGTPNATPSASFAVTGCGASNDFHPGFTAGTVVPAAGATSPFTLTVSRADREQDLAGLSFTTPPGLLANLANATPCAEPQAAQGDCPAAADIGTATVAAGAGSEPLYLAGKVYLTGPYNGNPYGVSIVVPADIGPFHLGEVIIRASVAVNPTTAALTIATDPLPQTKDGIPLRIRTVNVTLDRPGFISNPTSCARQSVTATASSAQGTGASMSSPFTATGCKSLKFTPKLTVTTSGKTSAAKGASLAFKLAYPKATRGEQANIGAVKIDLPRQLPSRLTTLQQACLAKTFAADPASCPPTSVIGHATISTPILPAPVCVKAPCPGGEGGSGGNLIGPAYFVSHNGEAFPSLEIVLQGDGVRIDLVGTTFISNKRITSVTFRSIPDVPVNTFTLTLPEGPYSALGTNKNLCKLRGKLRMPTALTGQNGAAIHVSTKVGVSGCPPTRPRAHKKAAKRKKGKTAK